MWKTASADVAAGSTCRLVQWNNDELKAFLGDNPSVRAALQDIIGADLASKLRENTDAPPLVTQPAPA